MIIDDPMFILYGFKAIRISLSYVSVTITANYMAQVYMDKVLINQENPQHLSNFVLMFCVIDAIIFALLLGLVYLASTLFSKTEGNSNEGETMFTTALPMLIKDYLGYILVTGASGYIITMSMYKKKFFMYKDDGLRGIRALKEIMFNLCILHGLIPYNLLSLSASTSQKKNPQ